MRFDDYRAEFWLELENDKNKRRNQSSTNLGTCKVHILVILSLSSSYVWLGLHEAEYMSTSANSISTSLDLEILYVL